MDRNRDPLAKFYLVLLRPLILQKRKLEFIRSETFPQEKSTVIFINASAKLKYSIKASVTTMKQH